MVSSPNSRSGQRAEMITTFLAWIAVAFFVHSHPQYNFNTIHVSVYPFFCSHFFLRYEESLFIYTTLRSYIRTASRRAKSDEATAPVKCLASPVEVRVKLLPVATIDLYLAPLSLISFSYPLCSAQG